jgi:hypothetical protein
MDDIILANYVVVCHTENCSNNGNRIAIQAPTVDPNFICGVCNQPITDATNTDTVPDPAA